MPRSQSQSHIHIGASSSAPYNSIFSTFSSYLNRVVRWFGKREHQQEEEEERQQRTRLEPSYISQDHEREESPAHELDNVPHFQFPNTDITFEPTSANLLQQESTSAMGTSNTMENGSAEDEQSLLNGPRVFSPSPIRPIPKRSSTKDTQVFDIMHTFVRNKKPRNQLDKERDREKRELQNDLAVPYEHSSFSIYGQRSASSKEQRVRDIDSNYSFRREDAIYPSPVSPLPDSRTSSFTPTPVTQSSSFNQRKQTSHPVAEHTKLRLPTPRKTPLSFISSPATPSVTDTHQLNYSETAKRILETLDQLSSPLEDLRRQRLSQQSLVSKINQTKFQDKIKQSKAQKPTVQKRTRSKSTDIISEELPPQESIFGSTTAPFKKRKTVSPTPATQEPKSAGVTPVAAKVTDKKQTLARTPYERKAATAVKEQLETEEKKKKMQESEALLSKAKAPFSDRSSASALSFDFGSPYINSQQKEVSTTQPFTTSGFTTSEQRKESVETQAEEQSLEVESISSDNEDLESKAVQIEKPSKVALLFASSDKDISKETSKKEAAKEMPSALIGASAINFGGELTETATSASNFSFGTQPSFQSSFTFGAPEKEQKEIEAPKDSQKSYFGDVSSVDNAATVSPFSFGTSFGTTEEKEKSKEQKEEEISEKASTPQPTGFSFTAEDKFSKAGEEAVPSLKSEEKTVSTGKLGETGVSQFSFGEAGTAKFGEAGAPKFGETGTFKFGDAGATKFGEIATSSQSSFSFGTQPSFQSSFTFGAPEKEQKETESPKDNQKSYFGDVSAAPASPFSFGTSFGTTEEKEKSKEQKEEEISEKTSTPQPTGFSFTAETSKPAKEIVSNGFNFSAPTTENIFAGLSEKKEKGIEYSFATPGTTEEKQEELKKQEEEHMEKEEKKKEEKKEEEIKKGEKTEERIETEKSNSIIGFSFGSAGTSQPGAFAFDDAAKFEINAKPSEEKSTTASTEEVKDTTTKGFPFSFPTGTSTVKESEQAIQIAESNKQAKESNMPVFIFNGAQSQDSISFSGAATTEEKKSESNVFQATNAFSQTTQPFTFGTGGADSFSFKGSTTNTQTVTETMHEDEDMANTNISHGQNAFPTNVFTFNAPATNTSSQFPSFSFNAAPSPQFSSAPSPQFNSAPSPQFNAFTNAQNLFTPTVGANAVPGPFASNQNIFTAQTSNVSFGQSVPDTNKGASGEGMFITQEEAAAQGRRIYRVRKKKHH